VSTKPGQLHDTHNIYYSVNPTRTDLWNKATKEDIARVEFALADLDPREDETSDEAKDRYFTALEHNEPHPSAIIDSGNGLQVLWRLDQPIALGEPVGRKYSPEDQARIDDVEARIGALIVRLGGETGTQNVDRILRLPGTINWPNQKKRKAGRVPCATRVMVFEDSAHPLDAFPKPTNSPTNKQLEVAHAVAVDVRLLVNSLDETTKKLIKSPALPDEDRSEVAFSVMKRLMHRGWSDASIEAVFDTYPIGKRYITRKKLLEDIRRVHAKTQTQPILVINESDPTDTAKRLAVLIAQHGEVLFNENEPIRIASEAGNLPKALVLNAEYVRVLAHELAVPVKYDKNGNPYPAPLSADVANIYLHGLEGRWDLRPFRGITTCPILETGGATRTISGYDPATGLWCYNIPALTIPEKPTKEDAKKALGILRHFFRTFAFADASMTYDSDLTVDVVDDDQPGMDESTFLCALMTGVCRPSLEIAPGFLTNAPNYSGAGTGKGLLVKAVSIIASGSRPSAFTSGHDALEFDKRLTAALVGARPCIFLDNFNAQRP
jgi:hypothetical protein